MPTDNGDVPIAEFRRSIQQMFFGFASLRPASDSAHRYRARSEIIRQVQDLGLVVRGERGEVVEDVLPVIEHALDEVFEFALETTE